MSVALIDHVGTDLIASNRSDISRRYAISVEGRNFPQTESKSFNLTQGNIDKLRETAETFGMEPAVAFVFVDEMEEVKKVRIFILTLENLEALCENSEIEFLQPASDGITFKYTEGKNVKHLSAIKKCDVIDYSELQFSVLDNQISFIK